MFAALPTCEAISCWVLDMNGLRWIVVHTIILMSFVAVSPFIGWYAHLIWRALQYGWDGAP